MVEMKIEYAGALRCRAAHGPSRSVIETDAPADNHGRAERFSPTDLVGAALAACIATTLGITALKTGWDLTGMRVGVKKEMTNAGPRRIARLTVEVNMPAAFPLEQRALAEEIAQRCPVKLSLHPDVNMPIVFSWE